MLQSLSEQSDERKHTLNKLLETLGMDAIICTINERKLYEIAKNSEQFRKITEKGKDLRRDPFQSLLS
jgi:H2-forming N5,N10-methylenetetrahydromethanopterin dehydrogenase-like enzyme